MGQWTPFFLVRAGYPFLQPRSWPNWRLLRRFGFVEVPSDEYFRPFAIGEIPELYQLENWQLVPGDKDAS